MGIEIRTGNSSRKKGPNIAEEYERYLVDGRKVRSIREAHTFALAMRHKGVTFDKSVSEIITELEGGLPSYWTDLAEPSR